jgi:single stranded DNA-binding protein
MNYQKLIVVGNATRDAEHKTSRSGDVGYTIFRLAVSDSKERPVFFPITVFGKQAEVVAQYVTKGRQVLVEGRVEASESGRMSVIADRVVFGTSPDKTRADNPEPESVKRTAKKV